jgi:hypothetical protein
MRPREGASESWPSIPAQRRGPSERTLLRDTFASPSRTGVDEPTDSGKMLGEGPLEIAAREKHAHVAGWAIEVLVAGPFPARLQLKQVEWLPR